LRFLFCRRLGSSTRGGEKKERERLAPVRWREGDEGSEEKKKGEAENRSSRSRTLRGEETWEKRKGGRFGIHENSHVAMKGKKEKRGRGGKVGRRRGKKKNQAALFRARPFLKTRRKRGKGKGKGGKKGGAQCGHQIIVNEEEKKGVGGIGGKGKKNARSTAWCWATSCFFFKSDQKRRRGGKKKVKQEEGKEGGRKGRVLVSTFFALDPLGARPEEEERENSGGRQKRRKKRRKTPFF